MPSTLPWYLQASDLIGLQSAAQVGQQSTAQVGFKSTDLAGLGMRAGGGSGVVFDFRHDKRAGADMIDELGRVVFNACSVVPDGVVLFLPSYSYEEQVPESAHIRIIKSYTYY